MSRCRCGRFSDGGLCARCDVKERRILIDYPVVFYGGRNEAIGNLRLPKNLHREEADRVRAMVDALVIETGSRSSRSPERASALSGKDSPPGTDSRNQSGRTASPVQTASHVALDNGAERSPSAERTELDPVLRRGVKSRGRA